VKLANNLIDMHVQTAWRSAEARRQLHQHVAARCIQRRVRGMQARGALARRHAAATIIQARWRMVVLRRAYVAQQKSVVIIQAAWRYRMKDTLSCAVTSSCRLLSLYWQLLECAGSSQHT
jgi:hypothetical protein